MADDQSPLLLGPPEVLEQYLLSLDPESLQAACRSCPEFADICRNDGFWKSKLEYDYSENIEKKGTWKGTWIELVTLPRITFTFKYSLYQLDKKENYTSDWYEDNIPYRNITKTELDYLLDYFSGIIEHSEILNKKFILDDIIIENREYTISFVFKFTNLSKRCFNPEYFFSSLRKSLAFQYGSLYGALPLNEGDIFYALALQIPNVTGKITKNKENISFPYEDIPANYCF